MKQSYQIINLLLCLIVFPLLPSYAYYPNTLWSSDRIEDQVIGLRAGRVIEASMDNIVTLTPTTLTVYHVVEQKLEKILEYKGGKGTEWIKLNLFDLDNDGVLEVILTGFRHQNIVSILGKVENNRFRKMAEIPSYLATIKWGEENILVAQKRLGENDFTGPLGWMKWENNRLIQQGEIILPGGLSGESFSLYGVQGVKIGEEKEGLIALASSGKLSYYQQDQTKFKRQWSSGEEYGGDVVYLNHEVKDILGQTKKRRFFVPVSFHLLNTSLYMVKNSGYLKNVIGSVPSIKNTQVIRLTWSGYGWQEEWNSPRLDGAISDFDLVDWDGDGVEEILASFLLRDKGYLDTLKKQDSLLIVIKP